MGCGVQGSWGFEIGFGDTQGHRVVGFRFYTAFVFIGL